MTLEQFEKFCNKLTAHQVFIKETPIIHRLGTSIKDYHHNIHVGQGDGAVYIGYKHNASKSVMSYDMKVEFNPSKFQNQDYHVDDVKVIYKIVFGSLCKVFEKNKKCISGMDFAFDFTLPMNKIIPYSLTGRQQDRHKGTIYYGNRGKHGYLRQYDKKKEMQEVQGIEIEDEYLTRVEYSLRLPEGVTINDFRRKKFRIDELYGFAVLDTKKLKGTLKACVLAYTTGLMDLKEFPRRQKENIKKALKEMEVLDLDHILESRWEFVLDTIKYYIQR